MTITMSKALSTKLAEILSNGTAKQKALLVCRNWTDMNARGAEPLLTEAEVRKVTKSLKDDEEKREYNKWIDTYNVYNRLMTLCGLVYREYQALAERVLGYLRVWEDYDNQENNLNRIYEQLISEGTDKQKEAFASTLKTLSVPYGEITQDKEGYVEITREPLLERIHDEVKEMVVAYSGSKAFVIAVEEWTKRRRCKMFMPDTMADALENIKSDYALWVAPKYSRAQLLKLQEQGHKITKEEARVAVFPSYEEIETNEEFLELFREKIRNIERYG